MPYSSTKLLWHLVTEQTLQASDDVLESELALQRSLLSRGLAFFQPPTRESREAFLKKTTKTKTTSVVLSRLTQFILDLSQILQVEEDLTKQILQAYLAVDFRGTKQSLKKLIDDDRSQRPLLLDIWQFYRAERLHLLQVLKEIICHASNPTHLHNAQFVKILADLERDDLGSSLVNQMETVMSEHVPTRETNGAHFSEHCTRSWVHFNLREQSELLQINLLHLHNNDKGNDDNSVVFSELLQLFINHGFGRRQNAIHLLDDVCPDLVESVGHLESATLVYLIDLPGIVSRQQGMVTGFSSSGLMNQEVDKMICSLGNCPEHGPIMLAWMLANYLSLEGIGNRTLSKTHVLLGERALQMRAVDSMTKMVSNEVVSSNASVRGIARGIFYAAVSVLASSFEPAKMGVELQGLAEILLRQETLADDFWKQGDEVGLGTVLRSMLEDFPADLRSLCALCRSLAQAGQESAEHVLDCLGNVSVYAEHIDLVPSSQLAMKGADKWQLLIPRSVGVVIPAGTVGVVNDGRLFRWQNVGYSGWKVLHAEMERLAAQISSGGTRNVSPETMGNVVAAAGLLHEMLRSGSRRAVEYLSPAFSLSLFKLVSRFAHVADPPLVLLAQCLRCLSALDNPRAVWDRLSEECPGLFPRFSSSSSGGRQRLEEEGSDEVSPGLIGALMAQQERVSGEYPLTTAFLDLLLKYCCASTNNNDSVHANVDASVAYLARDVFPSFQQWLFANVTEKEVFGQKMLRLFCAILNNSQSHLPLPHLLSQPAPMSTLVRIVGTGDRAVQSLMESQSSWESGAGIEMARMVNLAMDVFEKLLVKLQERQDNDAATEMLEEMGKLLCSQHLMLTVAHYVYHVRSLELPVSALRLLSAVAKAFPMSLLACLGGDDAEAVRDILVFRLDSRTEDLSLKVAIVDFFCACVDTQPGLMQMLIDGEDVSTGCLGSVVSLLTDAKEAASSSSSENDGGKMDPLQLSVTNFVLGLWQHQRAVAISKLKDHESFWSGLTWTLFDKDLRRSKSKKKLNSRVLRILAVEIYSSTGKVDARLSKVLERLCDEKEGHFDDWCSLVLRGIKSTGMGAPNEKDSVYLLGAWKSFLVVLCRDQPVTLSPIQCHRVASQVVAALRSQLADGGSNIDSNARVITSLAELCLVLVQRWQTKCADTSGGSSSQSNMAEWCREQGRMLEDLSSTSAFDRLHPRARAAILGVACAALRASCFKMAREDEEEVLEAWLEPAVIIVQMSFLHHDNLADNDHSDPSSSALPGGGDDGSSSSSNVGTFRPTHVPILSISLLRGLISRLGDSTSLWYGVVHRRVLVQTLLSRLHHCLRSRRQQQQAGETDLSGSILGLLILLARTPEGCRALLVSDLAQTIWLPLSDVRQADAQHIPVFQLALHLATTLLRVGRHEALDICVTAVALMQEQLTTFLLAPKFSVQVTHLELTVTASSFVGMLMGYHKQWQLSHPSSLVHFYRAMCQLVHISTCLLLRPSYLTLLIHRGGSSSGQQQQQQPDYEQDTRFRRMSSSTADFEVEAANSATPEAATVQNALLDAVAAGLGMLRALSPDLVDLVAGNVEDHGRYDQLLGLAFGSPSFEQEGNLTYGTLVSLANVCLRSVTRTSDRSPSPSVTPTSSSSTPIISGLLRPPASPTPPPPMTTHHMDRRRLVLVLEQSLLVMLTQSLLCLSDPSFPPRDGQLLRRELGAEFSSCIESMRRHVHRGAAAAASLSKSPQLGGVGIRVDSPVGGARGVSKSDETFMKALGTIVQSVFK